MTEDTVLKPQHNLIIVDNCEQKLKIEKLLGVMQAILDVCHEAGDEGAPGGTMYMALMTAGIDIHQFERIMAMLVEAGRLRKRGHLYFWQPPAARVTDGVQPPVRE